MTVAEVVVEITGGNIERKIEIDVIVWQIPRHDMVALRRFGDGLFFTFYNKGVGECIAVKVLQFVSQFVVSLFVDVDESVVFGRIVR